MNRFKEWYRWVTKETEGTKHEYIEYTYRYIDENDGNTLICVDDKLVNIVVKG